MKIVKWMPLMHTFPTHQHSIPSPLSSLPEATSCFPNQDGMADPAVFGSVNLLTGAVATARVS